MKTQVRVWPWLPLTLGILLGVLLLVVFAHGQESVGSKDREVSMGTKAESSDSFATMSEEQWRQRLTPDQFRVLREKGTERAFTGQYWDTHTHGVYRCAACGQILYDYIDDLYSSGNTAGHIGIAWGWYLISPNWASVWPSAAKPLAYDEPDSAKAMIIMTDGEFNVEYTADKNGHNSQGTSFDQAKTLCDNIKAEGVRIYTVAFQAPWAGRDVLNYCASSTEYAFTPDSADELKDAYTKIAQSISDLRIRY